MKRMSCLVMLQALVLKRYHSIFAVSIQLKHLFRGTTASIFLGRRFCLRSFGINYVALKRRNVLEWCQLRNRIILLSKEGFLRKPDRITCPVEHPQLCASEKLVIALRCYEAVVNQRKDADVFLS